MAYTAPTTRITGDVITSGHWNTDITSNIAWLATDKPMCRVKNAGSQSINNGDFTALTFDSEDFDNSTMHSTSTNTSRITFATAGRYLLGGASVAADSTADFYGMLMVQENGSAYVARQFTSKAPAPASTYLYVSVATLYAFAANGYAELVAKHEEGGAVSWGDTGADAEPSNFWAVWMGTS